MRYEVLIMLAVVGAINLVGRVLAKRAQSKAPAPAVPTPQPKAMARQPVIVRGARVTPNQAAAVQPTVASPAARSAAPAPVMAAKPRNRWNARTLRRAFVAGEVLGKPVGQRH